MSDVVRRARAKARQVGDEYRQGEDRPLRSFSAVIGVYLAIVGAGAAAVRASGRELPERVGLGDVALLAVSTHKLSRLLAKDPVTSPLRAPFTRFEGTTGPAELKEEVRDDGVRKAVGELVTCPFCISQWIATGLAFGLVVAPRATRLVASVFAALAGSDLLQFAYAIVEQREQAA
jgi:hypothetical protein